jgi:hypothetical protein
MAGICKLCLRERPLQKSHLLPAALYQLMYDRGGPIQNPIHVNPERTFSSSRETTARLLCSECEQRFHSQGEDWVLDQCWRGSGVFRLYDELETLPVTTEDERGRYYEVASSPRIKADHLVYFATSVFWRAAVWPAMTDGEWSPIELGRKYTELLRTFLLSEVLFPEDASLKLVVCSPTKADRLMYLPVGGRSANGEFFGYNFAIPGMFFAMSIGGLVPVGTRELCLANNQRRPVEGQCFSLTAFTKLCGRT